MNNIHSLQDQFATQLTQYLSVVFRGLSNSPSLYPTGIAHPTTTAKFVFAFASPVIHADLNNAAAPEHRVLIEELQAMPTRVRQFVASMISTAVRGQHECSPTDWLNDALGEAIPDVNLYWVPSVRWVPKSIPNDEKVVGCFWYTLHLVTIDSREEEVVPPSAVEVESTIPLEEAVLESPPEIPVPEAPTPVVPAAPKKQKPGAPKDAN
jgi:hypothetical protein